MPSTAETSGALVPSFLVTAKGAQGRVVRFQSAPSGVAALAALEREGLQEARLVLDDTAAMARSIGIREAERTQSPPPLQDATKAYQGLHQSPGPLQRSLVAIDRRQIWLWMTLMTAGLLSGLTWWQVAIPPIVGGVALKFLTLGPGLMIMHERLLRALARNQGQKALGDLDRFEKSLDSLKLRPMVGTIELATLRARAQVMLGHAEASADALEPALAGLQRACDAVDAPEWFALVMRFRVYMQAQEFEAARQAMVRAIEIGPPCATFPYDLALLHGLWLHDLPKAQEYLHQLRSLPIPEVTALALPLLEAVVMVESRQWQAAQDKLKCLDSLPSLMKLMMADEESLLRCVVAGALGDKAKARRHLKAIEPILRTRKDPYWLNRCQGAAGR